MESIRGNFVILNEKAVGQEELNSSCPAAPYYEVIRVIRGIPLFLEDHLTRFYGSVKASGIILPDRDLLNEEINTLIRLNGYTEGNIKLITWKDLSAGSQFASYFIPHFYPDPAWYQTGVKVLTYKHTRNNPGIKKWDAAFRQSVAGFIKEKKIFEAILTDENGCLTEGSRSNLFFTGPDDRLYTSPDQTALKGITKIKVEEICRNEKIQIIQKAIRPEVLNSFNGCILTGTSPKIMPVSQLNDQHFDPSLPIIKELMDGYERITEDYLRSHGIC